MINTFTSGIAGEDIADGEVVVTLTADGRLYAKPPDPDSDERAGEIIIQASEYCALCNRIKELENEIIKLKRACAVLYWGSPKLCRLAENEYSGCASTQRECCDELRRALERNV